MHNSTPAVFSHNPAQFLPNSTSLKFNMSMVGRTKEHVRYAYIRIAKKALGTSEMDAIKNTCDLKSGVELQLYTRVNITENSLGVFSILTKTTISEQDLLDEQWVEFGDITRQFKGWMDNSLFMDVLEMRVVVGGSCYNQLQPQQLGIEENLDNGAYMVTFSKNEVSNEKIISVGMAELAAQAPMRRRKRQDVAAESTSPCNSTDCYNSPCSKQPFTVSITHITRNTRIIIIIE